MAQMGKAESVDLSCGGTNAVSTIPDSFDLWVEIVEYGGQDQQNWELEKLNENAEQKIAGCPESCRSSGRKRIGRSR